LNIGDPAPPLQVRHWLKGEPFQKFEKGQVYVVEFWATWCSPCIAMMPDLSALARKYKKDCTILAIDTHEGKNTSPDRIQAFVDSMGNRMNYSVATEDSNAMETTWMRASGSEGIPKSFVVDREGRLAWIGHPMDLPEVLAKVMSNSWDIKESLSEWDFSKYLEALDSTASEELNPNTTTRYKPGDLKNPDSMLAFVNEMVRKEPELKYTPAIAFYTFSRLLKTNPDEAYIYGKELVVTPTYESPPYNMVIKEIRDYDDKSNLPAKVYELGAEACRRKMNHDKKFGNINIPKNYRYMAEMYWRSKHRSKAIKSQRKAIATAKMKKYSKYTNNDVAAFKTQLKEYKKTR
jgi:thiol-disulfide isomerase/thioredoxin